MKTETLHFLPESGWMKKTRAVGSHETNNVQITITKAAQGNRPHNLTIRFYGGCSKIISETGFAQIQIYKNRVFFRQADEKEGYKLSVKSKNPETAALQITITDKMSTELSRIIGDYDLKYDNFYEIYYVELEG